MPPLAISRDLFCFLLHMYKNTHIDKFLCINEYKCESMRKKITHTHQGGGPPFYIHNSQNIFMVLAHTHTHTLSLSLTHVIMEANNSLLLCFTPNQWRNQYTCWYPCVVQNGTWTTENVHIKKLGWKQCTSEHRVKILYCFYTYRNKLRRWHKNVVP